MLTLSIKYFSKKDYKNIILDTLLKGLYYTIKCFNMLTLMTCNGYFIFFNALGIAIG